MSRMSRAWLVEAFRQRVEEANQILSELRNNDYDSLMNDEWGGIMSDPTIMTREGNFRNNASQLNMRELENRIQILDSFLEDSPEYNYEGEELSELGRRLGVDPTDVNVNILLALLDYMKSKIKDGELDSHQMLDIARARLENGQSLQVIKNAFDEAVESANGDPIEWFNRFSERGRLI